MALSARDLAGSYYNEVITSPFTFFATAGALYRSLCKPVFVDIDLRTFNLDIAQIESKISEKTSAIMPVNLFGQMCDIESIESIDSNLYVIQDSCQSIGALWKGKKINKDVNCLSFFPSKNLGCFGDGGAVLTDDEDVYNRLKQTRNHGQSNQYFHDFVGGNFRGDAIQAAILSVKLKRLNLWTQRRQANAELYDKLLRDSLVITPYIDENAMSVYNQYTIQVNNRDEVKSHLLKNDIGCAVYYPLPLHLQPCFQYLGYKKGDFPNAEYASEHVLSLPIYPELTEDQICFVAEKVLEAAK